MNRLDEAVAPDRVRDTADAAWQDGELPPEEERIFNESVRAGFRAVGELVRKRKKSP